MNTEPTNRAMDSLFEIDERFPPQNTIRQRSIWASALRIVYRKRAEQDPASILVTSRNVLRDLQHGHLFRIPKIHDFRNDTSIEFHGLEKCFDHVGDVAKAPGLLPFPVDRERLFPHGLEDEIRDQSPIIGRHERTIGIEEPDNANVLAELILPRRGERLCSPLTFIVRRSRPDRIYVPGVIFFLWMNERIAVDF